MSSSIERDLDYFGQLTAEEACFQRPRSTSPCAILVRFDRVYGNVVCYPANQQAEVLARIAGTKTLLPRTLAGARALGLQVMEIQNSGMLADFLVGE